MTNDAPLAPFIAEIERRGGVLKVMADYCSSGLWDGEGCESAPEEFGLPASIETALDTWIDHYHEMDDPNGSGLLPGADLQRFDDEGRAIARLIKDFFGGRVRVVFFSESKLARRLDNCLEDI